MAAEDGASPSSGADSTSTAAFPSPPQPSSVENTTGLEDFRTISALPDIAEIKAYHTTRIHPPNNYQQDPLSELLGSHFFRLRNKLIGAIRFEAPNGLVFAPLSEVETEHGNDVDENLNGTEDTAHDKESEIEVSISEDETDDPVNCLSLVASKNQVLAIARQFRTGRGLVSHVAHIPSNTTSNMSFNVRRMKRQIPENTIRYLRLGTTSWRLLCILEWLQKRCDLPLSEEILRYSRAPPDPVFKPELNQLSEYLLADEFELLYELFKLRSFYNDFSPTLQQGIWACMPAFNRRLTLYMQTAGVRPFPLSKIIAESSFRFASERILIILSSQKKLRDMLVGLHALDVPRDAIFRLSRVSGLLNSFENIGIDGSSSFETYGLPETTTTQDEDTKPKPEIGPSMVERLGSVPHRDETSSKPKNLEPTVFEKKDTEPKCGSSMIELLGLVPQRDQTSSKPTDIGEAANPSSANSLPNNEEVNSASLPGSTYGEEFGQMPAGSDQMSKKEIEEWLLKYDTLHVEKAQAFTEESMRIHVFKPLDPSIYLCTADEVAEHMSELSCLQIETTIVDGADQIDEGFLLAILPKMTERLILFGEGGSCGTEGGGKPYMARMASDWNMWDRLVARGLPFVEVPPAGVMDGLLDTAESATTDDDDLSRELAIESSGESDIDLDSGRDGDIDSENDHDRESRQRLRRHRRPQHSHDSGDGKGKRKEKDGNKDQADDEDKNMGKKEETEEEKNSDTESAGITLKGSDALDFLQRISAIEITDTRDSAGEDSGSQSDSDSDSDAESDSDSNSESDGEVMGLETMEAWQTLEQMVGLEEIKERIRFLHHRAIDNRSRKKQGLSLRPIPKTGVLLGPPGTGKTTVARLYARILHNLGFVKNKSVFEINASKLVDSFPHDELKDLEGRVVIIDDAHGLWGGSKSDTDREHRSAIQAIVALVSRDEAASGTVLLVGYEDEMENMFEHVSPGLSTRFPLASAFRFPAFSMTQLEQLLDKRLDSVSISTSPNAKSAALAVLGNGMASPRFGNATEVDTLLQKAYFSLDRRCMGNPEANPAVLEPSDVSEDWNRHVDAETECRKLFQEVVGCESVISEFIEDARVARNAIARKVNPRDFISFNYIFRGASGTGKTSTARKMGQIFYHMGLLPSAEVLECSVSDIVGEYIGQTGPKTIRLLNKAIGKVLLIDEAYRLNEGFQTRSNYSLDAIAEIVGALTSPQFQQKLVIILAGYTNEMDQFLNSNPGLRSRFNRTMTFPSLDPTKCIQLLAQIMQKQELDISALRIMEEESHEELFQHFAILTKLKGWGNARDIHTLSTRIYRMALSMADDKDVLVATRDQILVALKEMITSRGGQLPRTPPPGWSGREWLERRGYK